MCALCAETAQHALGGAAALGAAQVGAACGGRACGALDDGAVCDLEALVDVPVCTAAATHEGT